MERLDCEEAKVIGDIYEDLRSCRTPYFSIMNDCTTAINGVPYCATVLSVIVEVSGALVMKEYAIDYSPFDIPHTRARAYDQLVATIRKCVPRFAHKPLRKLVFSGVFDCAKNTPREVLERVQVGVQDTNQCFGHRTSTAQQKINSKFPELKQATDCVVGICGVFRKSTHNSDILKSLVERDGKRFVRARKLHNIRWNSLTRLLSRAKSLQPYVHQTSNETNEETNELVYWPKMKFRDTGLRDTFRANVDSWHSSHADVIKYIYPVHEKLTYWSVMLEAGTRVTTSLVSYAVGDLYAVVAKLEARVRNKVRGEKMDLMIRMLQHAKKVFDETFVEKDFVTKQLSVVRRLLDPRVAVEPGGDDMVLLPFERRTDGSKRFLSGLQVMTEFFESSDLCEDLFGEFWAREEEESVVNQLADLPMMRNIDIVDNTSARSRSRVAFALECTQYFEQVARSVPLKRDESGREVQGSFNYYAMLQVDPLQWWTG